METIRRGGRSVQGFALGTIFGAWTVEDLDKLIKNKDVEMAAIGAQVATTADPAIKSDWATINQVYQAARATGLKAIAAVRGSWAITPDSLNATADTDAAFKGIIAALQPKPGQVTPGSKQDIANRLVSAGWKPTYQLPFPTQSDADLTIYKNTENVPTPSDIFKWFADHKTALIVGGAVVGGVVVLGALSPYAKLLAAATSRKSA